MAMEPELKKLWVDALESGEYTQGTGMLKYSYDGDNESYCCLGVLCDVLSKLEGEQHGTWDDRSNFVTGSRYNAEDPYDMYGTSFIPDVIAKSLGIDWLQQNILAGINDESEDFTETTQWIKDNL